MAKKYTADTFEGGAGNLTSLAVNTDDLVAGGGSVGIGTSSPSVPLTVQSNSGGIAARLLGRSSDGYAFFTFRNNADSATNGEIGVSDSQNMLFYTGASERMRIDSSGNVGINDSSPSYLFNIKGTEERIGIKDTSAGETWNNTDLGGFVFRTHYATQEKTGMYAVGLPHGTGVNYQPQLEFKTSNTTRLTINPNGNVGIGTTDPTSKLQVEHADFARLDLNLSNSSGTTIADVRGLVSGTEKWRIGKTGSSSDDFTINVTGSERMRIDSSGNVGIGASNPQKKLVISESTNATIRINSTKNGTWTSEEGLGHLEFFSNDTSGEGAAVKAKISATSKDTYGAAFNMTFGTTDGSSGISERMRIRYDGFVGIGETDPDRQLHLKSSLPAIRLEDSDVSGLYHEFFASTAGMFQFKADGGNVQANSGFLFQVDNSEKMRIDSSGNVEIGTSSARPDEINDNGIAIHNSGKQYQFSSSDFAVLKSSSTGTKIFFRYGTSGSQNTQIGSISYPTTSSVAYNTTSDYRLKENVVDMTGALDRVEQLQPKRFNFIQDPEITFDGFLAHEVQSVIPEAITGEKDAVDDEGNPEYQGIDQSKIVPLLVGAIKELKAEIETLKSQINS